MIQETPNLAQAVSPRTRGLFLKNLGDFQTELARIHAGFLPAFAVWRQRKEFPAHIFRSLRRVQDLRQRGRELGVSFQEMHHAGGVAGRELLDAVCHARGVAELLRGGVIAVSRALLDGIDAYLADNARIYDQPTVPLLAASRDELAAQVKWAEAALAELAAQTGEGPAVDFVARIDALAAGLAAELREAPINRGGGMCPRRRVGTLPWADATLPVGFRHLEFGPEPVPRDSTYEQRARYHAVNFLQEVQAADSCASILFESPDMPWDYFFDLGRQMWDEARHAVFGETKLAEFGLTAAQAGLSTKAYAMRQTLAPLDRYAALSTQEADAFPGKHQGLKDALAHHDATSATGWSYDIADETQHVRFGAKWIPVMIEKTGESRGVEQVRADAENWRASVFAEVYKPAAATLRPVVQ
ncbi:MAG: DUF455 family protein [Opitutus sp.]|nr:DUF455 family protein [Opitutus sp.]